MRLVSRNESDIRRQVAYSNLPLSPRDHSDFESMFGDFAMTRLGPQGLCERTVELEYAAIANFVRFCRKPPHRWTYEDFKQWTHHIGHVDKRPKCTQRRYVGSVRTFLEHICDPDNRWIVFCRDERDVVLHDFLSGVRLARHVYVHESPRVRRAFSRDEILRFFGALDVAILDASDLGAMRDVHNLLRDKAAFLVMYAYGMRIEELCNLDRSNFFRDDRFVSYGKYGQVKVVGKGAHGSGPRTRVVATTCPEVANFLNCYVEEVRPKFMTKSKAGEDALVLSERGRRIGKNTLSRRFAENVARAGLSGNNLTPHCLRHSYATHELERTGNVPFVQMQLGHATLSSTQRYVHFDEEYRRREAIKLATSQIDAAVGRNAGRSEDAAV